MIPALVKGPPLTTVSTGRLFDERKGTLRTWLLQYEYGRSFYHRKKWKGIACREPLELEEIESEVRWENAERVLDLQRPGCDAAGGTDSSPADGKAALGDSNGLFLFRAHATKRSAASARTRSGGKSSGNL